MKTFLDNLTGEREGVNGVFVATSRYYPSVDFLLYLAEDLSYRADRVDEALTVLWHPYEDRLVGLKLKGFSALLREVKGALDLEEAEYVSLVTLLTEAALTRTSAQKILNEQETARLRNLKRKYLLAANFARNASVSVDELKKAA